MPRKNPMPQREIEICERFKEFRQSTLFTRVAFSKKLGVDSSLLSNVENCLTPLRFELAKKVAGEFKINPQWLATGKGLKSEGTASHLFNVFEIDPRCLYSEAYDDCLSKCYDGLFLVIPDGKPLGTNICFPSRRSARIHAAEWIAEKLDDILSKIPDEYLNELMHEIERIGRSKFCGNSDALSSSREKRVVKITCEEVR